MYMNIVHIHRPTSGGVTVHLTVFPLLAWKFVTNIK